MLKRQILEFVQFPTHVKFIWKFKIFSDVFQFAAVVQ